MITAPELIFLAAAEVAKKPEGMTFERWLTLFGFFLSVVLGIVTLMKFLKERRDAKDVKNVAELKAPAEKDVIIVTGAHSAVLMMEQAAKAAREEADRKQIELDRALTRNAELEEKIRVRDEKIDDLESQIDTIQQQLNSVNRQLQSLKSVNDGS